MSQKRAGAGKSDSRKGLLLQVRIDANEKAAFEEAAELAGIAVSAWVRERLRQVSAKELEAVNRPIAFLKNPGRT